MDPAKVEAILTIIFKIASRWKAILLLDEADIFMAQRTNDNHSNALVSVFLRELEHFDGVLFLTTNRLQTFDAAILSRIHVSLKYSELGRDAREAVWRFFVRKAVTKQGKPSCSEGVLKELAEKNMNGREVREFSLMLKANADC